MVEVLSLAVAAVAAAIAGLAWWQSKRSADAGVVSARAAESSAEAARRQVALSSEQFEAERAARRDALQPFVVVDIVQAERDPWVLYLRIENRGASTARNVRIAFDPPPARVLDTDDNRLRDWPPLADGIPALPPGRRLETVLDTITARATAELPTRYAATVTAEGPFPDHPPEPVTHHIDLGFMFGFGTLETPGGPAAIARRLEQINDTLGRQAR